MGGCVGLVREKDYSSFTNMVVLCPACAHQQPSEDFKFCCECGARLTGNEQRAQVEVCEPLTKPLGVTTDSSGVVHCATHKGEKVIAYCERCGQLPCILCLTQKPKPHAACGDVLPLEQFLALSDPFTDQKRRLSQAQKAHEARLEEVQSAKDAQKTYEEEVAALGDAETQALKTVEENSEAAVAKLKAAKEEQRRLVLESTKKSIEELDRSIKAKAEDYTRSIGAITDHVHELSAAQEKLSAPFSATNMVEQVTASKEGAALLSKNIKAPTAASKTRAVTAGYTSNVNRLAELRVEIKTGKMEERLQKASNDGAPATRAPPKPKTVVPTVPLTGPGSEEFFVKGARVVPGPDWNLVRQSNVDGGRPGTVVEVHRAGDAVRVSWDAYGKTPGWFSVGRRGHYHLRLVY